MWVSINYKTLFETKRYKVAFSLKELVSLSSEFSYAKAKNCSSSFKSSKPKELFVQYQVVCREKGSKHGGHTVSVRFDTSKVTDKSNLNNLDVKVSCTCPAFLYWGAQWNLGQGDALEGQPRPLYQAPTDPRRFQFVICKHIKVVADRIAPYLRNVLKKYKDEQTQKILERYEGGPEVVEEEEEEPVKINEPKKEEKPKKEETPKKEEKKPKEEKVERTSPVKSTKPKKEDLELPKEEE